MSVTVTSLRERLPASAPMLVSLSLHGLLLALALLNQLATGALDVPVIASISVDLLSASQFAALGPPPAAPSSAPALSAPGPAIAARPAAKAPEPTSDGPVQATEFYAGGLLAEPASARLVAAMGTLSLPERAVQVCGIEAMEQIRRARPEFDPDFVVPYAMAETTVKDETIIATGAAFRSRREWYRLEFRCRPAADLTQVAAFEFKLGAAIPHEQWEAHDLTAAEASE